MQKREASEQMLKNKGQIGSWEKKMGPQSEAFRNRRKMTEHSAGLCEVRYLSVELAARGLEGSVQGSPGGDARRRSRRRSSLRHAWGAAWTWRLQVFCWGSPRIPPSMGELDT